jgi:hypothetical protein
MEEINEEIGWNNVVSMSSDLTQITLSFEDESGRKHEVFIGLQAAYPKIQPSCMYFFPEQVPIRWVPGSSHIKDILTQVCKTM